MAITPKKSGGIRLTINYKTLNNISILGQRPIYRVDETVDKLGSGRLLPLFDLVSSFHQITVHKDTISFTAFCTLTRIFEWLFVPQGNSAAPGWFVKVINEVIKGLVNVAAYLDDVIVLDPDPSAHVLTITGLFRQCGNTAPSSRRRGRRSVPPTRIFSVTPSPPWVFGPTPVKSLPLRKCRCLQTSRNYGPFVTVYPTTGNVWQTVDKRIWLITSLLKQGVKFVFTPSMKTIVRTLFKQL